MGALNDDAFVFYGQLGYTGSLPDREKAWLRDRGYENWYDFLRALGFSGSVPDMKYAWLLGKGYTGSLNDVLKQYFNEEISLILDFVNNVFSLNMEQFSLTSKVTFTRASTKTYWGSDGLLKTAAINEWPLEYDPATLQPLGRSVWEARTNLLTYSEQFDNASWNKVRASITPNSVIAPDGLLAADTVVATETNASGFYFRTNAAVTGSGTTATFSVFLKKGTGNFACLVVLDGALTNGARQWFNLSTGSVASSNTAGTGWSKNTASIENVGGGWYRCIFTVNVTGTSWHVLLHSSTNADLSFACNVGDAGYPWGAQLEAGAFATPYIKTEATTMTRAADVAVMTGTNFSDWYNQSEGTFVVEHTGPTGIGGTSATAVFVGNATGADAIVISQSVSGTHRRLNVADNNVTQALLTGSSLVVGTVYRVSAAYKVNDFAASIGGAAVQTDVSGVVPDACDRMGVGITSTLTSQWLNGYIRSIVYYPKRLLNNELRVESS